METVTETKPRIFLTDYASYNNGTQFEFGHWVDLDQFNDAEELQDYITEHFKECDEKSPLDSPREEIMITDYEGFPESFYSESSMDFESLYSFLEYLDNEGLEDFENEGDNLLWLWNEYCQDNRIEDEVYPFDDEHLEMLIGSNVMNAFQKGCNSEINWSDDYIYLNGYGNIVSINDPSTRIDETVLIDWIIETKL